MKGLYFAFVLAAVVAATGANPAALPTLEELLALENNPEKSWDGIGLTADANHYVDTMLELVGPFMKAHHLDPFTLPDLEEGFEIKFIITYSAWLKLYSGSMTGLANVKRSGDQMVYYFARMLRVRVTLDFDDIAFVYRYSLKVMRLGPTGRVIGSIDSFRITCDVIIDFNNDEVQLQEFKMTDIGRIRVRLTGNLLLDWMINPVISVVTRLIENVILKIVSTTLHDVGQMVISFINVGVKHIVSVIENY